MSSVCVFLGAKNGKFGKVHKFAYNAERQGSTRGTALLMGQADDRYDRSKQVIAGRQCDPVGCDPFGS